MKLYGFAGSPRTWKVRAVAAHLGLPLQYENLDFAKGETRTPHHWCAIALASKRYSVFSLIAREASAMISGAQAEGTESSGNSTILRFGDGAAPSVNE